VLQKDLVGPVEALVKFSTLQEYGVDRIFFLENDNVDSSQQNVIFIAGGEKGKQAHSIAGTLLIVSEAAFSAADMLVKHRLNAYNKLVPVNTISRSSGYHGGL